MKFDQLVLEAMKDELWIVFFIHDYKTHEHKYMYSELSKLSDKWKKILNSLNEDNFHQKLGNKKDKQIRAFEQDLTKYGNKYPSKQISALISTKDILDETIESVTQDTQKGVGGSMTELIEIDKYNVDQEVKDAWKGLADEL